MSHLDIDKIIDFVMIDEINEKTKILSSEVNSHIMRCAECRQLVNAYQSIYDALLEEHDRQLFNNAEIKQELKQKLELNLQ